MKVLIDTPIFKYHGTVFKKKRNGFGRQFWKNTKEYYQGEWKDNKMNGIGMLVISKKKITCQGIFKDNELHGKGFMLTHPFICKECGKSKFYLVIGEFSKGYATNNTKKYLCVNHGNYIVRKLI